MYVRPSISTASTDIGLCSSEKPPRWSNTVPSATSRFGLVMSTTWMPSSNSAATTAYSLPPKYSASDAAAPSSALYRAVVEHRLPSCPRSAGAGLAGLVMSIIWNPRSAGAATIAYVRELRSNMSTLVPPPSIE